MIPIPIPGIGGTLINTNTKITTKCGECGCCVLSKFSNMCYISVPPIPGIGIGIGIIPIPIPVSVSVLLW